MAPQHSNYSYTDITNRSSLESIGPSCSTTDRLSTIVNDTWFNYSSIFFMSWHYLFDVVVTWMCCGTLNLDHNGHK
eukprot:600408-Amphidinium_carterae.1